MTEPTMTIAAAQQSVSDFISDVDAGGHPACLTAAATTPG